MAGLIHAPFIPITGWTETHRQAAAKAILQAMTNYLVHTSSLIDEASCAILLASEDCQRKIRHIITHFQEFTFPYSITTIDSRKRTALRKQITEDMAAMLKSPLLHGKPTHAYIDAFQASPVQAHPNPIYDVDNLLTNLNTVQHCYRLYTLFDWISRFSKALAALIAIPLDYPMTAQQRKHLTLCQKVAQHLLDNVVLLLQDQQESVLLQEAFNLCLWPNTQVTGYTGPAVFKKNRSVSIQYCNSQLSCEEEVPEDDTCEDASADDVEDNMKLDTSYGRSGRYLEIIYPMIQPSAFHFWKTELRSCLLIAKGILDAYYYITTQGLYTARLKQENTIHYLSMWQIMELCEQCIGMPLEHRYANSNSFEEAAPLTFLIRQIFKALMPDMQNQERHSSKQVMDQLETSYKALPHITNGNVRKALRKFHASKYPANHPCNTQQQMTKDLYDPTFSATLFP